MVRILSTLTPADAGSMRIAGHDVVSDPDGVRGVIGVAGQFSAVDNAGTSNAGCSATPFRLSVHAQVLLIGEPRRKVLRRDNQQMAPAWHPP
jgi:hypothetical protein